MLDSNPNPLCVPGVEDSSTRTALLLPPMIDTNGTPPGLSSAPTATSLFQALRRRWLLAFSLAFLGALLAVAGILTFFPAQYSAHVRIQIAARSGPTLFTPGTNDENDFLIYKASLAALIKSPLVVNAAVNQVKDLSMIREKPKPVQWLETALKTDFLLAPDILRVTLSGDDPEEVTKVLNAVTEAFLKEMENREKAKRQSRLEELKESQRQALETLHQKRLAFHKRLKDQRLDDPDVQKDRFRQFLSDLGVTKKTLLDKHLEEIGAEQDLKAAETSIKNLDTLPIALSQIEEYMRLDPSAQQLYVELAQIEKEIAQTGNVAKDKGRLKPLAGKKSDLRKRLEELREQLRPELEKKVRQDLGDKLKLHMLALRDKIVSLQKQQESLAAEVQVRQAETDRLKDNPLPLDMIALRDDIVSLQEAQKKVNEMIAGIKAEPLLGRITLLQRAETPTSRDYGRQAKFAGVAGVGMFGLLLLGVSWFEFRLRRISAADEVVHGLKMGLVGTLPALPYRARRAMATASTSPRDLRWQGQLTEAVDAIRTLLLHSARTESMQVVMVTSAMNGEGKTSLASQLAASLARAWRKTLLVDGDLRNSALHKLFGLPQEPGLSEVLRGEITPADTIRATSLSRLWLLPAGHWDSHAVQALAQDGVREMFNQLKHLYDFIIVDSCPVLPVADSLLLGQHVDAVIFSILRDVSRVPAIHAAQQRLNNLRVRILGAVVIGDQAHSGGEAYRYQSQTA
jgi:capsular exopolysaccharide synthesis family protein